MILEFNKNIHRDIYPLLKSGEVVMMLENDHVLRQKGVKKTNNLSKQLSGKIDDFLILCVYEQDSRLGLDHRFGGRSERTASDLPIFIENEGFNSFIIWERVYRESAQVFNSLRVAARNRFIRQIADNIVTHLLMKYKKFSPSLSSILNDKTLKSSSIHYIENILKRDTFLVNDEVWENFCRWCRMHLTEWVLEEMAQSLGPHGLEALNRKELNELFYEYISKNLSEDQEFIIRFTSIVNTYTLEWIKKISRMLNLEDWTMHEIEAMFNLKKNALFQPFSALSLEYDSTLATKDFLSVMNNAPYQSVREALYKNHFLHEQGSWPTMPLSKGNMTGVLQIKPFKKDHYRFHATHPIIKESWKQAEGLSDLDADVFDALCAIFLSKAKHYKDVVEVEIDDLLSIRGLKPKLGGEGRRGGYELKQRRQVLKSLSIIQNLWIELDKAIVYEKGKPVETKLEGRAFLFVDQERQDCRITEEMNGKKLRYTVDQVFAKYLSGSGRQVALLPIKTLHYDPYRKTWEKRLARYLSWRWRIQARKGDFLQPNKVNTLLEAISVNTNERMPSRTRDRLEKALDTLQQDGLIQSWHYEKWNELIADQKGWGRVWAHSTIVIDPPEYVKEQYRPIKRNQSVQSIPKAQPDHYSVEGSTEIMGSRVREIRERLNLSLHEAAEEIQISSSYLSSIERGRKIPSNKIQARLIKWLERFH